jgi:hypothetical protein
VQEVQREPALKLLRKEVIAMTYETPELLLVGPASSLVLGSQNSGKVDRFPESDLRKGTDAEVEGLDD